MFDVAGMGELEPLHHVRDCCFDENASTHEITSLSLRKTKMGTLRERVKQCPSGSWRTAFAMVHCFGDNLEHARDLLADFGDGKAFLSGGFHRSFRQNADRHRVVDHGVWQLFCHPFVEEIDAACAHSFSSQLGE
ncbi:hypothetical protein [Mesorhizobium loti]|uniref:hypothetical protein n=1 Tax=Rhizobium loti TaxID=381 RepID=UPI001FD8B9F9|nr:hypothetical protein [Mesorhizobium loti]